MKTQETTQELVERPLDRFVRRLRVDELICLAFMWAEQDRAAMADAWDEGTPERTAAESQYQQLKAYRTKRWGRTQMEAILSKPVKSLLMREVSDRGLTQDETRSETPVRCTDWLDSV